MALARQRCARAYSLSLSPSRTAGGIGGAARGNGTSLSGIKTGALGAAGVRIGETDAISDDGRLASLNSWSGGTDARDLAAISDSCGDTVELAGADTLIVVASGATGRPGAAGAMIKADGAMLGVVIANVIASLLPIVASPATAGERCTVGPRRAS